MALAIPAPAAEAARHLARTLAAAAKRGHVIGASLLGFALAFALMTATLFGDPRLADEIVIASITPAPPLPSDAHDVMPLRGRSETSAPHEHHDDAHLSTTVVALRTEDGAPSAGAYDEAPFHALEPRSAGDTGDEAAIGVAVAPVERSGGLPRAPISGLTQTGPGGVLPMIAADGRRAMEAYARPFDDRDDRPKIALIVGGLGLNKASTQRAIDELPSEITLGFVPYAPGLQGLIDQARSAGHEVILELPMEPFDYPANDPGPHTLLADVEAEENLRRLDWLMARASGYFAVMNYLGARFTASEGALAPVLEAVADRGVGFIFDGESKRSSLKLAASSAGIAYTAADRLIDATPSAAGIDEQLLHLEALALQQGDALGAGYAYPVTVDQLKAWATTLEIKGYVLAPASAVLAKRAAAAPAGAETIAAAKQAPVTFQSVEAGYAKRDAPGDAKDGHGEDKAAKGGGH